LGGCGPKPYFDFVAWWATVPLPPLSCRQLQEVKTRHYGLKSIYASVGAENLRPTVTHCGPLWANTPDANSGRETKIEKINVENLWNRKNRWAHILMGGAFKELATWI